MIDRSQWMAVACPTCGTAEGAECCRDGATCPDPHGKRVQRAREEADFWAWVDDRIRATGQSEQSILDSIRQPGWTGRRARSSVPARRVIPMPPPDRKMAAAGDFGDAA